jgi:hypothetical protein
MRISIFLTMPLLACVTIPPIHNVAKTTGPSSPHMHIKGLVTELKHGQSSVTMS